MSDYDFDTEAGMMHFEEDMREIRDQTPPMPDKTPERLPDAPPLDAVICGCHDKHVKTTSPCYLCREQKNAEQCWPCRNPTPPTEPQEVEALEDALSDRLSDKISQMYRDNAKAPMMPEWESQALVHRQLFPFIKAELARERTSAAIDELTAFKDLAMVYSDGSPANLIVMDEEEAVTYIDARIAALTAQQKGEASKQ